MGFWIAVWGIHCAGVDAFDLIVFDIQMSSLLCKLQHSLRNNRKSGTIELLLWLLIFPVLNNRRAPQNSL